MNHALSAGMIPGGWELLVVLFVILLLFGGAKLPQLAKGMGKSIREFKKGINEGGDDDEADEAARRAQLRTAEANRLREDELASEKYTANKPR
ncbi:MAG: twin-arginine translocase TatA/TatE family subunit [Acidobacteria bacterium]|nr:twin-arginine translocase TatA/TatE family subunit [Acidobacteriota bacterium]